ncbi:Gfo/Idh/MocA family oxidoreductase [Phycicoccus sp. MAQZ13P-2]|uniref:Gfo/Idh/MocA family protein n=1 Tax=Phycicoccus mangrovi TaxID=2840470 RepID=UPI001C007BCB|nr:Gfo/Idh/MocA family oxidoreductase [Phycicoccus mangrovi]MBT9256829.1 Gfo/Idh/MocA family oxidoreductase [Phycicoccus mangrovi]MBT9275022.1 Gfo/Idh/MocA family oxidoreductase [Phycicoccus mangrovi]
MRVGLAGAGRIGAFHARTLAGLEGVGALVVADADAARAAQVAATLPVAEAVAIDQLVGSGLDALVVATSTPGHAPLVRAGVEAGVPVFVEKPLAATLDGTLELVRLVEAADTPVHVGFQRRFDTGYRRAREAVASGALGFVHTLRATTSDRRPPHPDYVPTSGGIFRDCAVHDADAVRFVTGREVLTVQAVGGTKGEPFFAAAGDVASAAALLTLDDGTIAVLTTTRYSGQGHDVRLEVVGSEGSVAVGLDDSLALRSVEDGVTFPAGPVHEAFMDRFEPAYRAELAAFLDVARGAAPSPCTVRDALEASRVVEAATLALAEGRTVALSEIPTT